MKKKHIFYTITMFLFSFVLSCISHERTKEESGFLPQDDTVYMQAQEAIYSDPLLARRLLAEAMRTRAVEDSIDWYMLYNLYIKTYLTTSEFDTVVPLCQKTLQFCARQKALTPRHHYLLTDANNNIGNRYAIVSQNDSALKYFKRVLDYSRLTHNSQVLLTGYTNLADVYVRSGSYDLGAYYYRQALYLIDSCGLPQQELINVYTGLGQTYMELRDFELSHHYFNLAYRHFDQMDLNRKFVYFTNHGNVYYFEEKYPEALELFKKGYEQVKPSPEYAYAQSICMLNIGEIYLLMGQLDSAQYYLDRSYSYFETIGNTSALYHAQTLIFELALRKDSLKKATRLLHSLTDNLQVEPSLVGIRKKYQQRYYEQTGDFRKAYQLLKENVQIDNSIRNDRIRMRIAETELLYKQDTTLIRQQLYIQKQKSDMQSLELSAYIWFFACLLLGVIAVFIYFYQKKQRALLLAETRNKIIGLRMENIRNRVSPHFIFNTLNRVISHYEETDSNYKELYNLIKIMRLNLRLTEKLCIPLAEEIDFVRTYLDLEQGRFGSDLKTDIRIDPEIDTQLVELPSMMIQIPVENAIKHGLRGKEGEKQLSISVTREADAIIISIEDNGVGFRMQTRQPDMQSTGMGLKVLNQTIQLLNAGNSRSITLVIRKSDRGTAEYPGCQVRFTLPKDYSYALPDVK